MANAQIRIATAEDARGIAEVHVASWLAAYPALLPKEKLTRLDVDERERGWRERLSDAEALELRVWVALHNARIVGFACTQPSADEDVVGEAHELAALYLVPAVWRTGIGSALLSAAERSLRHARIATATLWVLEDNEGARTFYEAWGWKADKRDPSFKDFGAAALRYRKQL